MTAQAGMSRKLDSTRVIRTVWANDRFLLEHYWFLLGILVATEAQ